MSTWSPREQLPANQVWRVGGRYRVLDRIGAGGMADVFRAHDELLDRDVAVKVFRTRAVHDDASGPERQRAELHALARLNHPNLITLFDGTITQTDGPAYLVMELVDGPSLAQRINSGGLDAAEAGEVGRQVAEALAYVHAQGMVHRDVKPANILLGSDRTAESEVLRARLSDFGIVRLVGSETMTAVDCTLGTASYLAPEQARGSDVGPPADVYSLGLSLIEAVSGVRSFEGPPLEAAMARLSRDPVIPPDLSEPLSSLLPAMTARDPAARPSATRVAQVLRDGDAVTAPIMGIGADSDTAALSSPVFTSTPLAAAGLAAAPAAAAAPIRTEKRPRRRRSAGWMLAAAAVLAALAVGGVLLFTSMTPSKSSTTPQPSVGPGHTTPAGRHVRHSSTGVADRSSAAARTGTTTPSTAAHHPASDSASTQPVTNRSTSAAAPSSAPRSTSAAPSTSATPSVSPTAPGTSPGGAPTSSGAGQSGAPAG